MRREPMSSTESRNSLPSSVTISVPSPYHLRSSWSAGKSRPIRPRPPHRPRPWRRGCLRLLLARRAGGEVPAAQARRPPPPPARAAGLLAPLLRPGDELLVAHDLRDGVLADPLPGLLQVGGDPRGAVPTVMLGEQRGDLGG